MFTLDDAMRVLGGREEFAVKRRDGLVVVNYLVALPDSFLGIRENFRGVTFDEATGRIVSLPLHKFYNVNQTADTHAGRIGDRTALVFDKHDGTMTHALEVGGDVVLATRMGWDTEQAVLATALMNRRGLKDDIAREIRAGRTPIFEYVGPHNPVVLQYDAEDLVYLWSRDRRTGAYSRPLDPDPGRGRRMTINEVIHAVAGLEDREGFVCVLPDMWVKAKCPWYVTRHEAHSVLTKPGYHVYAAALEGKLDDLIALCADRYKPKLAEVLAEVGRDQVRLLREIQTEYDVRLQACAAATAHDRRKAFATAAKGSPHFGGLMCLYSGKPVEEWVNARLFDVYRAKYPHRLFEPPPDEP